MTERRREVELLLLPMVAAVPLYLTNTISASPLILFHLVMAAMVVRVLRGKTPDVIAPEVMRVLAIGYVVFYLIDLAALSH